MAVEAHQSAQQSNDADRGTRSRAEKSGWQHVAAVADSAGDLITIILTASGAVEAWQQSTERAGGYAQAA